MIIDDESPVLDVVGRFGRRAGFDVEAFASGRDALEYLRTHRADVALVDMRMPDLDGAQLLELVRKTSPRTVRIMLSGHAESESVLRALPLVHQFISKPSSPIRGRAWHWRQPGSPAATICLSAAPEVFSNSPQTGHMKSS